MTFTMKAAAAWQLMQSCSQLFYLFSTLKKSMPKVLASSAVLLGRSSVSNKSSTVPATAARRVRQRHRPPIRRMDHRITTATDTISEQLSLLNLFRRHSTHSYIQLIVPANLFQQQIASTHVHSCLYDGCCSQYDAPSGELTQR